MIQDVETIKDPKVRSHCRTMERLASNWREAVRRVNELRGELENISELYPHPSHGFADRMAKTIDSVILLKHQSDQMRVDDAHMREDGLVARQSRLPVTDNPYCKILADLDSDDGYTTILETRAAIPWYIGWKQGARAGERNLPE